MKKSGANSWLTDAVGRIGLRAGELGFKVIHEEDEAAFKDLLLVGEKLWEDAFNSISLALFELFDAGRTSAGAEFHAFFHTCKGRRLQRGLSKNDFEMLRKFLEESLFRPAALSVLEFDPASREYADAKRCAHHFPNRVPGVVIHIGGWLKD